MLHVHRKEFHILIFFFVFLLRFSSPRHEDSRYIATTLCFSLDFSYFFCTLSHLKRRFSNNYTCWEIAYWYVCKLHISHLQYSDVNLIFGKIYFEIGLEFFMTYTNSNQLLHYLICLLKNVSILNLTMYCFYIYIFFSNGIFDLKYLSIHQDLLKSGLNCYNVYSLNQIFHFFKKISSRTYTFLNSTTLKF